MSVKIKNKHLLQAQYASKAFLYLPITFMRRVVFGKDCYWKQFFWNKWGFIPKKLISLVKNRKTIWIDALSGGEITQLVTFSQLLRQEYPEYAIILSTNNLSSFNFVKKNIKEIDFVFDIPWDISFVTKRVLKKIRPELLIVVDQVRFPIILKQAKKLGVKTALISAALPNDCHHSYMARAVTYKFYRYFDYIGVTEELDREAYIRLGTSPDKVKKTGYMKYDLKYLKIPEDKKARLRKEFHLLPNDYVFVAGSVHQKEEKVILKGFQKAKQEIPNLKLILVPRYMNTVSFMEGVLRSLSINFVRRTQLDSLSSLNDEVLLVDTFGELGQLYSIASVIFIGNSIFPMDKFGLGQNIVEPLIHECPIFFGKCMNKWKDIVGELKQVWNGLEIENEEELYSGLIKLHHDSKLSESIANKCREIINRNKDAIKNNLKLINLIMKRNSVTIGMKIN